MSVIILVSYFTWGHSNTWQHQQKSLLKCIFFWEIVRIGVKISLMCITQCPTDLWSSLVQVMAWCLLGTKPHITYANEDKG